MARSTRPQAPTKTQRRAFLRALARKLGAGGVTSDGEVLVLPDALVEFVRDEAGSWGLTVEPRMHSARRHTGLIGSAHSFPLRRVDDYAGMVRRVVGEDSYPYSNM